MNHEQRYRVDVRLVQVATLLGFVSVLASDEATALARAHHLAREGKVVSVNTGTPTLVGYEVLRIRADTPEWDGTERRNNRREGQ